MVEDVDEPLNSGQRKEEIRFAGRMLQDLSIFVRANTVSQPPLILNQRDREDTETSHVAVRKIVKPKHCLLSCTSTSHKPIVPPCVLYIFNTTGFAAEQSPNVKTSIQ